MTRRRILMIPAIGILAAFVWTFAPPKSRIGASPSARNLGSEPALALAASPPSSGGALSLVASEGAFLDTPLDLVPADITVAETLETPVAVTAQVPKDSNRTHLFMAVSGAHSWHQVPSSAPYRLTGSYRVYLSSSVLPPPGKFSFGLGLDAQIDDDVSTKGVTYFRDPAGALGLDPKILAPILSFNFGLSQQDALQMARDLIRSDITITLTVRVRMRSVEVFSLENGFVQIWGD
jgi:hypothetical protein